MSGRKNTWYPAPGKALDDRVVHYACQGCGSMLDHVAFVDVVPYSAGMTTMPMWCVPCVKARRDRGYVTQRVSSESEAAHG